MIGPALALNNGSVAPASNHSSCTSTFNNWVGLFRRPFTKSIYTLRTYIVRQSCTVVTLDNCNTADALAWVDKSNQGAFKSWQGLSCSLFSVQPDSATKRVPGSLTAAGLTMYSMSSRLAAVSFDIGLLSCATGAFTLRAGKRGVPIH